MNHTLRRHPACLVRLALACLVMAAGPRLPGQEPYTSLTGIHVIRNARILVQPGKVLAKGSILIQDGIIRQIGESLEPPPGATILEGTDLVVTAGFVLAGPLVKAVKSDAPPSPSTSARGPAGPRTATQERLARGITPARMACEELNDTNLDGKQWLAQGVTAIIAFPAGQPAAGYGCLVSTAAGTKADRLHQEVSALRVSFAGVRTYPRSIMGTVAALRQLFISAADHVQVKELYRIDPAGLKPPVWQPDLDAMTQVIRGRLPVLFEARREGDIRRALGLCREFALDGWIRGARPLAEQAAQLADRGVVAIVDLNPGKIKFSVNKKLREGPDATEDEGAGKAGERKGAPAGAEKPGDDEPAPQEQPHIRLRRQEKIDRERTELARFFALSHGLSEKKVPFFFGARSAKDLLDQVKAQINWGLSAEQALMALTVVPARLLGLARSRGRIEPGMVADLVVFAGEPFNGGAVRHVFSRGLRHDVKAKKKDLDEGPVSEDLASLVGSWALTGSSDGFSGTLVLKREGESLGGSLSLPWAELAVSSATLTDREFKIEFSLDRDEGPLTISSTGTLSEDGKQITGSFESGSMPARPFKGTRSDPEDQR